MIYEPKQGGIPHQGLGIGDGPNPSSFCSFSFGCCSLLGWGSCSFPFPFTFLYFVNSLWKSAFNKKAPEDIDDVPGSWGSQVWVQTEDCSGWQKLHRSPRNLSLGLSFLSSFLLV